MLSRMRQWRTDLRPSPIQIHRPEEYWPAAKDPTGLRWQQSALGQGPARFQAQSTNEIRCLLLIIVADTCSIGCYFLKCGPLHADMP